MLVGTRCQRFAIFHRALVLAFAFIFSTGCFSCLLAEPVEKAPAPDPDILLRQKPPMRVVVVRNSEPGCEPNCAEWISAEGVILPETPELFEKIVNALGARKLPVFINSPGGVVAAGLTIGRMIRAHQMDVAVSKTEFKACPGGTNICGPHRSSVVYGEPHSSGAICASACTFILAGGARRFVAPWAQVGVHQITMFEKHVQRILTFKTTTTFTGPDSELVTRQSLVGEKDNTKIVKLDVPKPETLKSIEDFFGAMGISDELQNLARATNPDSLHWLTHAELTATHIATDYRGSEYLADPAAATAPTDPSEIQASSFAYGILRMESFTRRPVLVLLEFYHRDDAPNIEVFAFLNDRDQFVSNANFALSMQFGSSKQSPEMEALSARPFAPIHIAFSGSNLCLGQPPNFETKLTLIQVTKGSRLAGPTLAMDVHQLAGMNELLENVCAR